CSSTTRGLSRAAAAEAQACAGIAPDDRDISPFQHIEDITGVAAYAPTVSAGKNSVPSVRGAVGSFRALQGMTAGWLDPRVSLGAGAEGHVPLWARVPSGALSQPGSS